ncbi:hypothetical protein E1B28_003747 [Marasmius oreades]|uniref:Uncharacterized protein n=1 Tax=Marasmius oreades TaxID=181124 RepID=A0A9P7UX74_9AGAR|nr:uncharacterized protein E1B28_003747 [Marasmius oreades]KAG7096301.1 hypothetical protein E1B28_003747 [Marasmius oreades]
MFFKTVTIISTLAMLLVGQAMGGILIATDPVSACGPPNNKDHHAGSSCKFYSGPSDSSRVISGSNLHIL